MRMRQKLGNGRRHRGLRLWMGGGGRREVFGHDECRDEGRVANRTTCLGAPLQMRTKESDVRRERERERGGRGGEIDDGKGVR